MAWTTPRTWTDGELVTASIMNSHVRDNLDTVWHVHAKKSASESVTSSTALQDDDHLFITVGASDVWAFRFNIYYDADAAGDLKITFSFPASGQVDARAIAPQGGSVIFDEYNITSSDGDPGTWDGAGAGTELYGSIDGRYKGGGTSGTFRLRWAQATSSGTATRLLANSHLLAVKLA